MIEQDKQGNILQYLRGIGAYVIKSVAASRQGVPDVIVCWGGQFIALEIKADRYKKASKLQQENIEQITSAGGQAVVVSSLEEVKRIFNVEWKKESKKIVWSEYVENQIQTGLF